MSKVINPAKDGVLTTLKQLDYVGLSCASLDFVVVMPH